MKRRLTFAEYLGASAIVAGALWLVLFSTGCATLHRLPEVSGTAFVYGVHDEGSNYTNGIGLRVEAMGVETLRPVVRASTTNSNKDFADSGYTYSTAAGLRYGETWYGEAGYTWFGYATHLDLFTRYDNDGTSYWRVGYDEKDWSVAATYYPVFGGKYETDELRLESRFAFGWLVLFVEPAFYRMTLPVAQERVSDAALRVGAGVSW